MTWVKICGVRGPDEAGWLVEAGADAVGINLWPGSKRYVKPAMARDIAQTVRERLEIVAVVVNMGKDELRHLWEEVRPDWFQLHGDESADFLESLPMAGFKAIGIGGPSDVEAALGFPGERILIDYRDDVRRGGTGHAVSFELAQRVCAARKTILAGGLHAGNVTKAIQICAPWGVDVASGVEVGGVKDRNRVKEFVDAVRGADREARNV